MSKLSTQPYRGTRDFYPVDFALQQYIFSTWRKVCQSFGYEEYLTPTIEPIELYTSKTSEEIVQEQTYSFTDRGGRNVTIRPEMTPSVARLVASKQQDFGYPLRLFSIPNCMRYERPQKGRLREFWQLNADIFGVESIVADIEMIMLADALMKAFGAQDGQYSIRINSRKLLEKNIIESEPQATKEEVMRLIDKKNKIDPTEFSTELSKLVAKPSIIESLLTSANLLEQSEELNNFYSKLKQLGINIEIDSSITRGFDYYTDIVFEVFDTHPDNNRSMFGGGRYDNLIDNFSNEPVSSLGFGMGDATLAEFLANHDLAPEYKAATQLLIASIGAVDSVILQDYASTLRASGINVAVDSLGRKPDKKIKTAERLGIPFIMFIGSEEVEVQNFEVKNIINGDKEQGGLVDISKTVLDYFS